MSFNNNNNNSNNSNTDRRKQNVATKKIKDPSLFNEVVSELCRSGNSSNSSSVDTNGGSSSNSRDDDDDNCYKPSFTFYTNSRTMKLLCNTKDMNGKTILHVALGHKSVSDTNLFKLMEVLPTLILHTRDDQGQYPLHVALQYQRSERIVLKLIQLYPMALNVPDNCIGRYPIHIAIQQKYQSTVIIKMIEWFPNVVPIRDYNNTGEYLLHLAILHSYNNDKDNDREDVVLKLMEVFPNAIQVPTKYGSYPLHLALKYKQSESVIGTIMTYFPYAIQVPNNGGEYPLHLAFVNHYSETLLLQMIDMIPKVTMTELHDCYGRNPLHWACRYDGGGSCSKTIAFTIMDHFPQFIAQRDSYGRYPLHWAIINHHMNHHNVLEAVFLKTLEILPKEVLFENDSNLQKHLMAFAKMYSKTLVGKLNQIVSSNM